MEKRYPAIAGREKGPGPGQYGLPPTIGFIGHDLTKQTRPAYSFHGRMSDKMYFVDCSPGPQYHIDAKMTHFGRDCTPAYSMLGRTKVKRALPHPWTGNLQPRKSFDLQPPAPTPFLHHGPPPRYRTTDSVPAPNKYTLPPLVGSHIPNKPAGASYTMSACFSQGGPSVDLAKTPGPCRYNSTHPSVYLRRPPAFSMLGRHGVPTEDMETPGPGSYNPERVTVHKTRAPAFSMGIRHSEYVTPLVVTVSD